MKKIKQLFIVLIFSMLLFPLQINAQSMNGGGDVDFVGTIQQARKFYKGEYVKHSDFIIEGKFIDKISGDEVLSDDWRIFAYDYVDKNKLKIVLKHIPSIDTNSDIIYNDINYILKVTREKFNPNLQPNIEDTIVTTSTNIDEILKANDLNFYNSLGIKLKGEIKFNDVELNLGLNKISYTFIPNIKYLTTVYGYEEYQVKKGSLNIELIPNLKLFSSNNTITVHASNLFDCEYKLGKDGEWQIESEFNNLKPNTKYTVYCRVTDRGDGKSGTIVKNSIKTK